MVHNLEISIDDRDWPTMKMVLKIGTRVQRAESLYDVAQSKFEAVVKNEMSKLIDNSIQRRKQHGQ